MHFDPSAASCIAASSGDSMARDRKVPASCMRGLDEQDRKTLTQSSCSLQCFYCPVVRHLWWWLGGRPASASVMHGMLERGHSALVCPGGVRECLYMEHGREAVYLTKRTGFVRIALQHGINPCHPTHGCIAWYKSQASFPFTASCRGGSACTWSMASGCRPQEAEWLCADSAAA